jgi:hypothetical protein
LLDLWLYAEIKGSGIGMKGSGIGMKGSGIGMKGSGIYDCISQLAHDFHLLLFDLSMQQTYSRLNAWRLCLRACAPRCMLHMFSLC